MRYGNDRGQLLFPVLGVLFFFGMFWVAYVLWCRQLYIKMRVDAVADLVALSAARQQAQMLNEIGTLQMLENMLLPEIKGYGIMPINSKSSFEGLNGVLRYTKKSYGPRVLAVANSIARHNGGARALPSPYGASLAELVDPRLGPEPVIVVYFAGSWPVEAKYYEEAFYARQWSPGKLKAQPDHKSDWLVCLDKICSEARARLWLDVDERSALHNGGFPSRQASWLRKIGIQCFYPQFNARLWPKR